MRKILGNFKEKTGFIKKGYSIKSTSWRKNFGSRRHMLSGSRMGTAIPASFTLVQVRKRKQSITSIKNQVGQEFNSLSKIGEVAVDFFSDLYTAVQTDNNNILDFIPSLITQEDNNTLIKLPDMEEVKQAVWDLNHNSAPGPDGFHGKFFKKCWSIVGKDVLMAVQEFFMGLPIPKGMASALLVLIPKSDCPSTFSDFRPICLSNFINKVCTKVLVTRLKPILPKIISPEQVGFMANRDSADQVLLAQEMVHCLDKKIRGSNLIVKLDMAKAFDRVSWQFLSDILLKFGFSSHLVMIILNNLRATYLSVLINGSPHGFFKPNRGVKQGDPLSPFLFIIASEAFSRGLKWLMENNKIKSYYMGNEGRAISHLGYADDLLIFLNGDSRSLLRFKEFLNNYQEASGQAINFSKSSFICGKTSPARQNKIKDLLGMRLTSLPIKYLGVNLHKGINRFEYCSNIIKQFERKLSPWRQKNLSQGGRLILIKYVLNSIPLHVLAVDTLPKKVIKVLNSKMASFFWGSSNEKNKYHWIKWSKLCFPTMEGGLGIRSLTDLEKAFTLKLWWKWKTGDSLWVQIMRTKYERNGNMIPKITDSAIWRRICSANDQGIELCSMDPSGRLLWNEEDDGQFSFKSAFEEVRELAFNASNYEQIWSSKLELKIKLLQWKITKSILPTPDNLNRFQIVLNPSRCPMCKRHSDSMKHLFYQCEIAKGVWQYFMSIFRIYQPIGMDYSLSHYWKTGVCKTNLDDIIKQNIPGIICWVIWRTYADQIWGNGGYIPSIDNMIIQVKLYSQNWVTSLSTSKIRFLGNISREEGLIPLNYKLQGYRPQVITWHKPTLNWKLNVDASYLAGMANGGAVLRNQKGELEVAISFPITARSPLEAEIHALIFAMNWAVEAGYSRFQVETDSSLALSYFEGREGSRWATAIQESLHMCFRKELRMGYIKREGNWAAHHLAQNRTNTLIIMSNVGQLPIMAKRAFWMDFFGIPSLRL
ncbi:unnamed protein product [Cuscuta epithymum]|uniref:Reverse transcriptase domain-containing protein n=1 Tax=Cuscuta epithymum TaxID=186058 RepID=A0AAV0CSF8_9ASTE|nr:unnamed protein product [Cuscuta epithymum]